MAIAVEVLIGALKDAGVFPLLAIIVTGAIGWSDASQVVGPPARCPSRDVSPSGKDRLRFQGEASATGC